MIITGGDAGGGSVEILSSDGKPLPCDMPPLPAPRFGHTQDGRVSCGGESSISGTETNCLSLSVNDGGWVESHLLMEKRVNHTSWMSPAGLLLIGGAFSERSTELLSSTGATTYINFTLNYDTV